MEYIYAYLCLIDMEYFNTEIEIVNFSAVFRMHVWVLACAG